MLPVNIKNMINSINNATEKKAFEMGYDCGKNGANTTNCHFALFTKPEYTRAWERGKKIGSKERVTIEQI